MLKIIQIEKADAFLFALCEDGTLWVMDVIHQRWRPCERIETEENKMVGLRQMNIAELGFTGRAYRALVNYGIQNVGQILDLKQEGLQAVPRLGAKSYDEIVTVLAELGAKVPA